MFFLKNAFLALAHLTVKTVIIAILAICDLDRNIPRIDRPEIVENDNISPEPVDTPDFKASMQELLDRIFRFFEEHPGHDGGE